MTHTEWIVSLDDDLKDHDEMFVGNVRDGDRLTRCCDCEFCEAKPDTIRNITFYVCAMHSMDTESEAYCSWAERKEE